MSHAKLFAISEIILPHLFRIVNKKSQISLKKPTVFYIFFIIFEKKKANTQDFSARKGIVFSLKNINPFSLV